FGEGSSADFVGRLFANLTGIETTRIPYQGFGQMHSDIVAGRVDLYFGLPPNAVALEGKAKAMLITSKTRSPDLPSLPSAAEQGMPEFDASIVYAISAPKDMPKDITNAVNR